MFEYVFPSKVGHEAIRTNKINSTLTKSKWALFVVYCEQNV